MKQKIEDRKIVVVNQAANYLTIGICNAFAVKFKNVALVTGSVHVQGETLDPAIEIVKINRWKERPASKKLTSYLIACFKIFWLLHTKYRKHEVFFVSIPPMGYLLNLLTFQRFSMLIWDVYPDIFKVTGMKERHPIYRLWAFLNQYSFRKAFRLYTIGGRMADLLEQYVEREKIMITPIWSIFQENEKITRQHNPFIKKHGLEEKFVVQYSGNIGLSHRVEHLIMMAEKLVHHEHILFQIIGRGSRMPHLRKLVAQKNLRNCQFLPFQSDEMFPFSLSAADLGVVILDEANAKGSVPSKTYNLMSYGIPTIYIAPRDSELYKYSQEYHNGECFKATELDQAASFIIEISRAKNLWKSYSENALKAAENYRRGNADKIVELYLKS